MQAALCAVQAGRVRAGMRSGMRCRLPRHKK